MNSKKMRELIDEKIGGMRPLERATGINRTTIYNSLRSDEKFSHMPIDNFREIAHAMGMTMDELLVLVDD